MAFCAGYRPADIPLWMVSSYCVVVKDVIVQLIITLTSQLSYPPAIDPTLGPRFSLSQAYYSLCRGSLGTGPIAVDREQNTITDINNGVYFGLRYDSQELSMGVICTRGLCGSLQQSDIFLSAFLFEH